MSQGRIELQLRQAIDAAALPPRLRGAATDAVFGGGGRLRPRLCLAVSAACGAPEAGPAWSAAVSIELLHCASLVHDDLPCFDDAAMRRGHPSVHRAHGEALAVLAGDALIVAAFAHVLAAAPPAIGRAVGVAARCLVAGQGLESEAEVELTHYHAAKTGALFEAATTCGALAAGADPSPWREVGQALGRAYQLADDIADAGEDGPGLNGARHRGAAAAHEVSRLLRTARAAVPTRLNGTALENWFAGLSARLPQAVAVRAVAARVP